MRHAITGRHDKSRWIAQPSKVKAACISMAVLLAALAALGAIGCGGDGGHAPSLENPDATGAQLVNRYFTLLANRDSKRLEDFLSDAFIVQRADGSWDENKVHYLKNLPEVRRFKIRNVSASQDGDALAVRYESTVEENIHGKRFQSAPAPRLSTFVWSDGEWRLTSHANFNPPKAGSERG